ncbi:hypothetical protein ACFLYO_02225, partial [Chloroflexota bacterium]
AGDGSTGAGREAGRGNGAGGGWGGIAGGFGLVSGTPAGKQTERLITALIDSVDRNTALLVGAIERWQPPIVTAREVVREVRVELPRPDPEPQPEVSTGRQWTPPYTPDKASIEPVDSVYRPQTIIDKSTVYTRETHPKLFQVIDLLADDATKRRLSVRSLAAETGVSKSWCAIARRYWQQQVE